MADPANIAVIGAGLMGHGIAQVFAAAGHAVTITDPNREALESVRTRVEANLVDLGRDPVAAARIKTHDSLEATVAGTDVVIEAAPEKLPLKQSIFADLERFAPRGALLASNTSVIPIGKIAAHVESRDRVLGTHWWAPPYLIPLVEIVQAEGTSDEAIAEMMTLLTSVGKVPVHVRKDVPGFIGNRMQHALWREAIALVQEGVCDAPTVDAVVKASFGRRLAVIGPLESADMVGTDLALDCHDNLLADLNRTPGPLPYLQSLVDAGRLGFKTGEGFRRWTPAEQDELRSKVTDHLKKMAAALDQPHSTGGDT
jgi:3-hydroxybutyryl-CoA dehydrogenase